MLATLARTVTGSIVPARHMSVAVPSAAVTTVNRSSHSSGVLKRGDADGSDTNARNGTALGIKHGQRPFERLGDG